jgi:hypothetical protein
MSAKATGSASPATTSSFSTNSAPSSCAGTRVAAGKTRSTDPAKKHAVPGDGRRGHSAAQDGNRGNQAVSRSLCLLGIAAAAIASPVLAQQPQVVDAGAAADVVTLTTKIEAVDLASRVVAVRGPLGRTVALKVDDRVKNLPQVKAGDEIVLKYVEAVAVALVKAGGGRGRTVTTPPPVSAPAGAKPGGARARQTKIVARIEKVGAQGVLLLEGPNSRYAEVKVRDPAVLKDLKVGDDVEVTFVEALVVDVATPGK